MSQISLADDCEFVGDGYSPDSGFLRPMGDDPSRWVVSRLRPFLENDECLIRGEKREADSPCTSDFEAYL
jgi:hypothetical protein